MKEEGLTMEEVVPRVEEYRLQLLDELRKKIESQLNGRKYPPKVYLSMASKLVDDDIGCLFWYRYIHHIDMNQEGADCTPLVKCTTNALNEVEQQRLIISAQQVNIVLNIEYAVRWRHHDVSWFY